MSIKRQYTSDSFENKGTIKNQKIRRQDSNKFSQKDVQNADIQASLVDAGTKHYILWDQASNKPNNLSEKFEKNFLPCFEKRRWEKIKQCLSKRIGSKATFNGIHDIVQTLRCYSTETILNCNILKQVLDEDSESNYGWLLPRIAELCIELPKMFPDSIPLLAIGTDAVVSMSQAQVACLLANAMFCTYDDHFLIGQDYPGLNFSSLFSGKSKGKAEKLKCIISYFESYFKQDIPSLNGMLSFHRASFKTSDYPNWSNLTDVLYANGDIEMLELDDTGKIEDDSAGMLQLDFANKYIGGGVLNHGCLQEEIRFVICPELLVSRLFIQVLNDNEAVLIKGAQQFTKYEGYASSFRMTGKFSDNTLRDSSLRRLNTEIAAIDATPYAGYETQFERESLVREINKAFTGFYPSRITSDTTTGIATGNWGSGAFGGDIHLKALIQLMAATLVPKSSQEVMGDSSEVKGRKLKYYSFGDRRFGSSLIDEEDGEHPLLQMHKILVEKKISIGRLFNFILDFGNSIKSSPCPADNLFKFICDKCHNI